MVVFDIILSGCAIKLKSYKSLLNVTDRTMRHWKFQKGMIPKSACTIFKFAFNAHDKPAYMNFDHSNGTIPLKYRINIL